MYSKIKKLDIKLESAQKATIEEIENFENNLSIKLGNEYKSFLLEFGTLEVEYLEFYGYTKNPENSLNALALTKEQRESIKDFPKNLIVFFNAGDGSYYCVDSDDKVYRCIYNRCGQLEVTFKDFLCQEIESLIKK